MAEIAGGEALSRTLCLNQWQNVGVWHTCLGTGRIVVIALAGLLPEMPALAKRVRISRVTRARIQPFGPFAFAHGPSDIEARKVGHGKGAHRKAEILKRLIDLIRRSPVQDHMIGTGPVGRQDAVADEPVAHARAHADLAQCFAQGKTGGGHVRRRCVGHHDLQQFHHMSGREKVQSQHVGGPRGGCRNFVDIQIRGIGGQDAARFADPVQFGKDLFFDSHILEHGFDHQIRVAQAVIARGDGQRVTQDHVMCVLADLASFEGTRQVARDPLVRSLARLRRHFHQGDVQARQKGCRGDASPHGAATDDPDLLHRARVDALQLRQIADRPFREKGVDHALALVGLHQIIENLALRLQALGKGFLDGSLNRTHTPGRRYLAPPAFQRRFKGCVPVDGCWGRHFADRAARCCLRQ
mmetsp:Transcript_29565/g.58142  ORF Transcript_29565/g.58142 Transcript_29565/m.58142 type:complete len:412 (+) Transcript_29565:4979-6214(+)